MPRGGKRKGAGRPKLLPTKTLRVPIRFIPMIKEFIKNLLKNEKNNQRN